MTRENLPSASGSPDPDSPPARERAGGGLREVARLAYPLVLTQMSITAMSVADSAIVGRLGAAPLAAVGLGGNWIWTLACFFVGTSMAVQTFVAQRHGAGRDAECGAWSWQGLASNLPLAAIVSLAILIGADDIVRLLAPSESLAPLATGYMRARALGITGLTAAVSISSFFRGIGDMRTAALRHPDRERDQPRPRFRSRLRPLGAAAARRGRGRHRDVDRRVGLLRRGRRDLPSARPRAPLRHPLARPATRRDPAPLAHGHSDRRTMGPSRCSPTRSS